MTQFSSFGLPLALNQALARMKFETPTPIQAQAIPLALTGRDILGSAQTGTGKTGAFGVPLLNKLFTSPRGTALVLLPTRELAMQVLATLKQMGADHPTIRSALIIGGESMPGQIQQLRGRPRLIVGTPGRIIDHLERGSMMLHDTSFLVLDETDRMLDLGFGIQLEKIVKYLPKTRQTLMFSATLPDDIIKLSAKYLTNPERISVGSTTTPIAQIKQEIVHLAEGEKYDRLLSELKTRDGSIIIFVKTKWGAAKMATKLNRQGHSADAIHGDLHQRAREKAIDAFRNRKFRILVATDIAARGLDIPHIEHVINYDLPQCPEDYIHRIGRTARNGAEGAAICLITKEDGQKWNAIQKLIDPSYRPARPAHSGKPGGPGQGKPRKRNRSRFRGQRSAQPKAA